MADTTEQNTKQETKAAASTTATASDTTTTTKAVKKKNKRKTVIEGNAYIQSSYNNTIVTITDKKGNSIAWSSAGANGFKGAKKATPYAAQMTSESAINKAILFGVQKLDVFVKGVGAGRDQAIRGLLAGGNITLESITDVTPLAHNGCRPRKSRRV